MNIDIINKYMLLNELTQKEIKQFAKQLKIKNINNKDINTIKKEIEDKLNTE